MDDNLTPASCVSCLRPYTRNRYYPTIIDSVALSDVVLLIRYMVVDDLDMVVDGFDCSFCFTIALWVVWCILIVIHANVLKIVPELQNPNL